MRGKMRTAAQISAPAAQTAPMAAGQLNARRAGMAASPAEGGMIVCMAADICGKIAVSLREKSG